MPPRLGWTFDVAAEEPAAAVPRPADPEPLLPAPLSSPPHAAATAAARVPAAAPTTKPRREAILPVNRDQCAALRPSRALLTIPSSWSTDGSTRVHERSSRRRPRE